MKHIVVTPAGRKKFLMILFKNLLKLKEEFDEWVLWGNTINSSDIEYMKSLADSHDWIKYIPLEVKHNGNFSIASFFKYACDPDSAYLRLDDDICYIEKGSISNVFDYRLKNKTPFLVYGNIINNTVINYIHQSRGVLTTSGGESSDNALDYLARDTSSIAIATHLDFIEKQKRNLTYLLKFNDTHLLANYERVSINAISWLGTDFEFFKNPDKKIFNLKTTDEEFFLSVEMPKILNRPNVILGDSIFVHFSYNKQLKRVLENKEIYKFYLKESR